MQASSNSKIWPGLAITASICLVSYILQSFLGLHSIVLALLLGILVGNSLSLPASWNRGVKFSSGLLLELSIVLMAFGINFASFLKLGWETILIIIVSIVVVLSSTVLLSKKLNCPSSAGLLAGFGTAICGSSAIAALTPVIRSSKSDMGIALAVVNLYGLIGMILLPLVAENWLSDVQNGVLLGASLHAVGNVAGAGFAMSESIGELAVTVKLGRVALLTPALLIFGQFVNASDKTNEKARIKLPWYLISFIVVTLLVSFIPLPKEVLTSTKQISQILLTIAMAAIGLKVSLKQLISSGKKGLVFGGLLFGIQLVVIGLLLVILY